MTHDALGKRHDLSRWFRIAGHKIEVGRSAPWTEEEDNIIIDEVNACNANGMKVRWIELAEKIPHRSAKEIRNRWTNRLDPKLIHGKFTEEDDLALWRAYGAHPQKWRKISSGAFRGQRSDNAVKNRWHNPSFQKYIDGRFGKGAFKARDAEITREKKERSALAAQPVTETGPQLVWVPQSGIKRGGLTENDEIEEEEKKKMSDDDITEKAGDMKSEAHEEEETSAEEVVGEEGAKSEKEGSDLTANDEKMNDDGGIVQEAGEGELVGDDDDEDI